MIKKALGLVALLGALGAGSISCKGCHDYQVPKIQTECKVNGLKLQVLYTKDQGRAPISYRSLLVQNKNAAVLISIEHINFKTFNIKCDDGSRIYVEKDILFHEPAIKPGLEE